jgi:hypothetical protein
MAFKTQKIKQLKNLCGFKDEKRAVELIMRLSGWFNSHKSTEPNVILAGLTKIITEIHEKEKQESRNIKNLILRSAFAQV